MVTAQSLEESERLITTELLELLAPLLSTDQRNFKIQTSALKCGLFEIKKIGDDYFTFMTKCEDPKACSILLRGASKDVLNEIERNLHDALGVSRNVMMNPKLVPGGGAIEMELAARLLEKSNEIEGV